MTTIKTILVVLLVFLVSCSAPVEQVEDVPAEAVEAPSEQEEVAPVEEQPVSSGGFTLTLLDHEQFCFR